MRLKNPVASVRFLLIAIFCVSLFAAPMVAQEVSVTEDDRRALEQYVELAWESFDAAYKKIWSQDRIDKDLENRIVSTVDRLIGTVSKKDRIKRSRAEIERIQKAALSDFEPRYNAFLKQLEKEFTLRCQEHLVQFYQNRSTAARKLSDDKAYRFYLKQQAQRTSGCEREIFLSNISLRMNIINPILDAHRENNSDSDALEINDDILPSCWDTIDIDYGKIINSVSSMAQSAGIVSAGETGSILGKNNSISNAFASAQNKLPNAFVSKLVEHSDEMHRAFKYVRNPSKAFLHEIVRGGVATTIKTFGFNPYVQFSLGPISLSLAGLGTIMASWAYKAIKDYLEAKSAPEAFKLVIESSLEEHFERDLRSVLWKGFEPYVRAGFIEAYIELGAHKAQAEYFASMPDMKAKFRDME